MPYKIIVACRNNLIFTYTRESEYEARNLVHGELKWEDTVAVVCKELNISEAGDYATIESFAKGLALISKE